MKVNKKPGPGLHCLRRTLRSISRGPDSASGSSKELVPTKSHGPGKSEVVPQFLPLEDPRHIVCCFYLLHPASIVQPDFDVESFVLNLKLKWKPSCWECLCSRVEKRWSWIFLEKQQSSSAGACRHPACLATQHAAKGKGACVGL